MKHRAEAIATRALEDCARAEHHWAVRYLGWDQGELARHLVTPPRSCRFRNGFAVGYRWLWVVLDELPESPGEGLLVVLDPRYDGGTYGLARKAVGRRLGEFLGYAGGLASALETIYESWPSRARPPNLFAPGLGSLDRTGPPPARR